MILSKLETGEKSLKGKDTLTPMFKQADTSGTGVLDFEAWKVWGGLLKARMAEKYGASYTLTDD